MKKIILGLFVFGLMFSFGLNNAQAVTSTSLDTLLSKNYTVGSRGEDVKTIQSILIEKGLLAPGNVTGYYGPLTARAVASYRSQSASTMPVNDIAPILPTAAINPLSKSCHISSFTVNGLTSATIANNVGASLAWTTTNCSSLSISNVSTPTRLPLSGKLELLHPQTGLYTLTAKGLNNSTVSKSVSVILSTLPAGCTSSVGYSPLTGLPCFVGPVLPAGCTSTMGYSPLTGLPCNGGVVTGGGPVISSVSGPQSLNVGQQGTWTVIASDSSGGNLSYSVVWGDETYKPAPPQPMSQTATFTHVYSTAGEYVPTFTVTNQNGQSAETSLSVRVGGTISNLPSAVINANPSVIPKGNSSVISWTSRNASTCVANGGISGWQGTKPTTGIFLANQINQTTTFHITCSNTSGQKASASVRVIVINPPVTVLSPKGGEAWMKGTAQTIKWQDDYNYTTDAIRYYSIKLVPDYYSGCGGSSPMVACQAVSSLIEPYVISDNVALSSNSFSWIVGRVSNDRVVPEGSYMVEICEKSTNKCGSSNSHFRIIASNALPPNVTIVAGQTTVPYNGSTTIRWNSQNATSCTMNGGVTGWTSPKPTSGVFNTGPMRASTTFHISCTGNGMTATGSVRVNVTNPTGVGPVISGVSGPQSLNVGQQGTWTVIASDSSGGNLSYSVVWGDETYKPAPSQTMSQTATFTHVYSVAGNYNPTFTVTNQNGQSAQSSLSVRVLAPVPSSTSTINVSANALSAFNNMATTSTITGTVEPNVTSTQSSAVCNFTQTLRQGMNNSEVKCLQQMLGRKGFKVQDAGSETTYFGEATLSALKAFQTQKGLVADGIFGAKSRAVLIGN
ncbi:MAG TPA: peptidoglycan-binding protein [Candidatus Paceibacterota bacterium]|nr:peptidoglycan-binding protein [Candidatus Paceibacterota bacterium]